MILIIDILFLILILVLIFWLGSQIVSSLTSAPYVVTAKNAYKKALELAKPKRGETMFDLGCGDGRVLVYANKLYGTKGFGFDISPYCILVGNLKKWWHGANQVKLYRKPLSQAEIEKADIIFLYLTNKILNSIENDLFARIKPSCRVITVAFAFKNHQAAKTVEVRQLGRTTKAHLYAKVKGN
jgi:SAM-dependent methyltransferase